MGWMSGSSSGQGGFLRWLRCGVTGAYVDGPKRQCKNGFLDHVPDRAFPGSHDLWKESVGDGGVVVVVCARGESVKPSGSSLGTFEPDEPIGVVSGITVKVHAASDISLYRVLVSEVYDTPDENWTAPLSSACVTRVGCDYHLPNIDRPSLPWRR